MVCVASFIGALAFTVLGMIVGEFEVSVDNDGWESRGTSLAKRQAQLELLEEECWDLNNEWCWDTAPSRAPDDYRYRWRSLLTAEAANVEENASPDDVKGWDHGPRRNRNSWLHTLLRLGTAGRNMHSTGDVKRIAKRRSLGEHDPTLGEEHDDGHDDDDEHDGDEEHDEDEDDRECWVEPRETDLVYIWRAKDKDDNMLAPERLKDVCRLELEVLKLSGYDEICRRVFETEGDCSAQAVLQYCAPHQSLITYLRNNLEDGWNLPCNDLIDNGAEVLEAIVNDAADCIARGESDCGVNGFAGSDFRPDDKTTRTLATFFPMDWNWDFVAETLKGHYESGDLSLSTDNIKTAYDMREEGLSELVMDDILVEDMVLDRKSVV